MAQDTINYEDEDKVKDHEYYSEISNHIILTPAYDPVNAEITVKLGAKPIPQVVKEVCDCFNFPISVNIDFYFVVRSRKR